MAALPFRGRAYDPWGSSCAFNGSGSQTFRKKAVLRGLEPDECYFVGARRGMPHLAM